ncbi:MAG: 3-phosphoserine/phosphohydroxythreonine transaminase [Christensenellaceae bacterium]|nr:3-phosphoserine/phosphohydroxythreonine transaminase [Christensenellaceae bacterium]
MKRVYNFSAGPACLPLAVLEKAQSEFLCYGDSGMSVMEMSHRTPVYQDIFDRATASLRKLMNIPENYEVLYVQGGASMQFDMVPMNLMSTHKKAYYINTGNFAKTAMKEAKLFGEVICPASSEEATYTYIPEMTADMFSEEADYVHITSNNTIFGTRYIDAKLPPCGDIPIVTDMSSCILSEPIDVSKYGLIYAGAQKNIGPAGVAIVIIRKDLIGKVSGLPAMLDYAVYEKNGSMKNTPPTYAVYMAGLVFDYLLENGGLEAMKEKNEKKAAKLYAYIDSTDFYKNTVNKEDRSIMNVTFVTGDADLDKKFAKEAAEAGLVNLKGHRLVGGMRASIYNAMPEEGIDALIEFMKKFEAENK